MMSATDAFAKLYEELALENGLNANPDIYRAYMDLQKGMTKEQVAQKYRHSQENYEREHGVGAWKREVEKLSSDGRTK